MRLPYTKLENTSAFAVSKYASLGRKQFKACNHKYERRGGNPAKTCTARTYIVVKCQAGRPLDH